MKRSLLLIVVFLSVIFLSAFCLLAKEKAEEAEKPAVSNSLDNIEVKLKIVISDKGRNDITYNYECIVQAGGNFNFDLSSSVPEMAMQQSENEKGPDSKRGGSGGRMYIEGMSGCYFYSTIEGKCIILSYGFTFDKIVLTDNGKVPIPKRFKISAKSVHKNNEQIKVFSGNFVEPDKSITLFIGAKKI